MKHGVYSKQYSLVKRADKFDYYLVFMAYVTLAVSRRCPRFRAGSFRIFLCIHETHRSTTRMQRVPGVSWLA